eukprot:4775828-Pleurochrysis_carterae.AAC.3
MEHARDGGCKDATSYLLTTLSSAHLPVCDATSLNALSKSLSVGTVFASASAARPERSVSCQQRGCNLHAKLVAVRLTFSAGQCDLPSAPGNATYLQRRVEGQNIMITYPSDPQ